MEAHEHETGALLCRNPVSRVPEAPIAIGLKAALSVVGTKVIPLLVNYPSLDRECQKVCVRAVLSDIDESFSEDDGELCFGLEPFPWRAFPRRCRMTENEI